MAVYVEIETMEASKKLQWAPIASFSSVNEMAQATEWVRHLLSGFNSVHNTPFVRIVNSKGELMPSDPCSWDSAS